MQKIYPNIYLFSALILISFFTGCYFFSGSFIPSSIPFVYAGGDEFLHFHRIKVVAENPWIYFTQDLGWPFASNLLDYPMPDTAHYLLHKLLFLFLGNIWAVGNAHFLIGFPLVAVASFWVLRQFSLSIPLAFAGALIYANLPFHYMRFAHLFYTWYFLAPLITWYSWKIFTPAPLFFETASRWYVKLLHTLSLIFLASFGVYYTFFGMMMMFTAGGMGTIKYQNYKHIFSALIAIAIMSTTLILTVTPNLIHRSTYGKNPEVAARSFVESEVYGLKVAPLLLPRVDHRLNLFHKNAQRYHEVTKLTHTNGNITNSFGIIGSVGFIALLVFVILNLDKDKKLPLLDFLGRLTIVFVLFATMGGFAVLFSMFVMPEIRAWDRISVFIAFFCITASLLLLQHCVLNRISIFQRYSSTSWLFSALLIIFALWDQTTQPCKNCMEGYKLNFYSDAAFIKQIEEILPVNSAIYQLPYNGFPEMGSVNSMLPYSLLTGYLHSSKLKWSYGSMQGREGDLFFRALAQEPITKQVEIIKNLGFSAVYIDRRGYIDYGKAIEAEFTKLLGPPLVVSDNKHLVFYAFAKVIPS